MRNELFFLPVAALILAGCSGSPQGTPSAPTVEPATTVSGSPPGALTTPTVEPATASPSAPSGAQKSARGNLIKRPGDGATVTNANGALLASFVVKSIQVDAPCTGQFAMPAENGHFVLLEIDVETTAALADAPIKQFSLAGYGWKTIAPNGTTVNNNTITGPAFMCLTDGEQLPSALGPGEKATGKVVLDVPNPSGILVHKPAFMQAGWEWEYPAK